MPGMELYDKIQEAVAYVRSKTDFVPEVGLVLGSGLGPLADEVEKVAEDLVAAREAATAVAATVVAGEVAAAQARCIAEGNRQRRGPVHSNSNRRWKPRHRPYRCHCWSRGHHQRCLF